MFSEKNRNKTAPQQQCNMLVLLDAAARCGARHSSAMNRRPPGRQPMDTRGQRQEIARLYRQAFAEHGRAALWSSRPVPDPGPEDALAITESLRVEGNLEARRLAERIEALCRAAV